MSDELDAGPNPRCLHQVQRSDHGCGWSCAHGERVRVVPTSFLCRLTHGLRLEFAKIVHVQIAMGFEPGIVGLDSERADQA